MSENTACRFAHLTDPHLSSLQQVRWRQLLNKRITGYLSWRKRRRAEHRPEVLQALVKDLHETQPSHIAITGDLTHIGLPQEFDQARRWLETLGPPDCVTVIPGNHDAYIDSSWSESFARWQAYMLSDAQSGLPPSQGSSAIFPSLRLRGPVAFIGLSSAAPSPPFFATGQVGEAQLQQLGRLLEEYGTQGYYRVVLVHHPAVPGTEKWRKRLIDADRLTATLATHGAELVLHGHGHKFAESFIQSGARRIPVVGIPSASAIGQGPGRRAQYHLYEVLRTGEGWRVDVSMREFDLAGKCFRICDQRRLDMPLDD